MKKSDLLEKLEQSRENFLELLDSLTEEKMLEPALPGGWTVKDVLVHITLWEAELIKLLFQAQQGRKPKTILNSREPADQVNARWYAQHKDRDLEQALKDFETIRDQTIRRVQSFSDKDLTDPNRYKWLNDQPLWKWIAEDTFEHEDEHAGDIRRWKEGN
jgi:hypothetical protein